MIRKLRSFWSKYKEFHTIGLKSIATLLVVGVVVIFLLFTMASRGMGFIFNEVMARQSMMNGVITVSSLSATPWGTLSFEELQWRDTEGNELLNVPSGTIKVNMWDIITKNFKASAVRSIELNDAVVVVDLDDNNRIDFAPPSPDMQKPLEEAEKKPKAPKKTTQDRQEELGNRVRNFNWQGQHLDVKIYLNNCRVELFQRNRHYVMNDVNAEFDIDTHRAVRIDFTTGKFGGTSIGDRVEMKGRIDMKDVLKHRMPTLDMELNIFGVDPSSLGFGDSIHDKMTLLTHVTGDLNRPLAIGRVTMPILQIPALTFENIVGDVEYQDGVLNFKQVYASVYEGKLEAHGVYNLDTRAYEIYGVAKDLNSSIALKTPEFDVPVSANLNFVSYGQPKDMEVWGNFWSGEGRYVLIPIKGITGWFHNKGRHLSFADVKVQTPITTISTDALHIDNGELTMGPLNITSNGGSNFILYDESAYGELDEQMGRITQGFATATDNVKRIQDNTKALQEADIQSAFKMNGELDEAKANIRSASERMKSLRLK
ncbi:membrane biogenesis protein AsmA [Veillonella agrestimuris]|uniref:membrane biogenesis protein AsmA n=1 Tax=Veillonella agrestimuris TaxID=2941340 RepID=UPI00203F9923|nr:membrane biogenesis protein AsmA [Veillonella agrestimuris]